MSKICINNKSDLSDEMVMTILKEYTSPNVLEDGHSTILLNNYAVYVLSEKTGMYFTVINRP